MSYSLQSIDRDVLTLLVQGVNVIYCPIQRGALNSLIFAGFVTVGRELTSRGEELVEANTWTTLSKHKVHVWDMANGHIDDVLMRLIQRPPGPETGPWIIRFLEEVDRRIDDGTAFPNWIGAYLRYAHAMAVAGWKPYCRRPLVALGDFSALLPYRFERVFLEAYDR